MMSAKRKESIKVKIQKKLKSYGKSQVIEEENSSDRNKARSQPPLS